MCFEKCKKKNKTKSLHFLGITWLSWMSFAFSAVNPESYSTFFKKEKKKKKKDLLTLSWGGFLRGIYLVFSDDRKSFENKFRTRHLAIFPHVCSSSHILFSKWSVTLKCLSGCAIEAIKCHLKWANPQTCCKPIVLRNLLSNSTTTLLSKWTSIKFPNKCLHQLHWIFNGNKLVPWSSPVEPKGDWKKKIVGRKKHEITALMSICVCVKSCIFKIHVCTYRCIGKTINRKKWTSVDDYFW